MLLLAEKDSISRLKIYSGLISRLNLKVCMKDQLVRCDQLFVHLKLHMYLYNQKLQL